MRALAGPDEHCLGPVERIVIIAQGRNVHKALGEVLIQNHEETEVHDAGDGSPVLLPDALLHELADSSLYGGPLGLVALDLPRSRDRARALHKPQKPVRIARRCPLDSETLEKPVNDQVGISPDRGGEVRVALAGQTEMPNVSLRINGLLETPQQEHRDNELLGPAHGLREQSLKGMRRHSLGPPEAVAETVGENRQVLHVVLIGDLMHPVGEHPAEV